jgi:uncharacterized membrane protein YoaK (UPF0700 family)
MAAHIVIGGSARLAEILSVPVFIAWVDLTRWLVACLDALRIASRRPLLVLQFLMFGGFLILCVTSSIEFAPDGPRAVIAAMTGVAAMAVQIALVQLSVQSMPATAVMTTNITRFTMELGTVFFGHDPCEIAHARDPLRYSWQAILGFAVGCALGAACQAVFGMRSLLLPTGIALVAIALDFVSKIEGRRP